MAKWRQTAWDKDEDKQKIALKAVINKVRNFCSGVVLVFSLITGTKYLLETREEGVVLACGLRWDAIVDSGEVLVA